MVLEIVCCFLEGWRSGNGRLGVAEGAPESSNSGLQVIKTVHILSFFSNCGALGLLGLELTVSGGLGAPLERPLGVLGCVLASIWAFLGRPLDVFGCFWSSFGCLWA